MSNLAKSSINYPLKLHLIDNHAQIFFVIVTIGGWDIFLHQMRQCCAQMVNTPDSSEGIVYSRRNRPNRHLDELFDGELHILLLSTLRTTNKCFVDVRGKFLINPFPRPDFNEFASFDNKLSWTI